LRWLEVDRILKQAKTSTLPCGDQIRIRHQFADGEGAGIQAPGIEVPGASQLLADEVIE
jgi:hypothetical protein